MNWKELKEFCNSLEESELSKNVVMWREDEAITSISFMQLEQDNYIKIGEEDNGCFDECEIEESFNDEGQFRKVYDKGTPILTEIF